MRHGESRLVPSTILATKIEHGLRIPLCPKDVDQTLIENCDMLVQKECTVSNDDSSSSEFTLPHTTRASMQFFLLLFSIVGFSSGNSHGQDPAFAQIEVKPGHKPEFPRVIKGTITDAKGKSVAGAVVSWGRLYNNEAVQETVTTGDDGIYMIETNNVGAEHGLSVVADGFCLSMAFIRSPGPSSKPTVQNLQLEEERTIEVKIVDEAGEPITGVEVKPKTPQTGFHSSSSMVQYPKPLAGHKEPTHVNGNGICRLRGLLPAPEELSVAEEGDSEAKKEARSSFNSQGWLSLEITSNGKWVCQHQISKEEYFESLGRFTIVVPDHQNPNLRRAQKGSIYGQVVDSDGNLVQNYSFTVRYKPEPISVKDSDGRFQWGETLDPEHAYEIRIFAAGYVPQVAQIVPDETREKRPCVIELERKPSTLFQFVDEQTSQPVPNAKVLTGVAKTKHRNYIEWSSFDKYCDGYHGLESVLHLTSDEKGRFTLPEGPSPSTLIILSPGYSRTVIMPHRRPQPDDDGTVRISLSKGGSIEAVRAAGSRIAQASDQVTISFESKDGFDHMYFGQDFDDTGKIRYESLAPGRYRVTLMQREANSSVPSWSTLVDIEPGKKALVDVGKMTGSLKLTGRTAPLMRVQLMMALKQPLQVAGFPLTPEDHIPEDHKSFGTVSDVDGYFEFLGLHPAQYEIEYGHHFQSGWMFGIMYGIKSPKSIVLTEETHLDAIAGVVTPPTAAVPVEVPAK